MSRMNVNLAGVELKNPVMTASGTFGSGAEYSEFVESDRDSIRNAQCHWSSESGD